MEEIIQLAKRAAQQAEVYQIVSSSTPVSFEANRLKQLETKETRGAALRLIKNGKLGFAATTDLRDPQKLVDSAAAIAELGAEARFDFPRAAISHEVQIYDPMVEGLAVEAMIEIGKEMIDRVRAYNPDILCDVGITKGVEDVFLINSNGGEVAYKKTVIGISLHGNLIRGTEMLDVYEDQISCRLAASYLELVDRLIDKFERAKRTASAASKAMPVIFTPKGFGGTLILPLQAALNGKTVLQGASALGDKLGQQIFDRRISLFDDATIDLAPQSAVSDDEGVATRRTPLIQDGALQSFYYDLQTAGLAGKESTGNGYRSLYSQPGPSLAAVIVAEGDARFKDMVAGIKEGVLVDQVMGAWAGNILAGDFSANIHLGYKIENGEIVGRVRDTMVAGNVFQALKESVEALGSEAVWVGSGLRAPAMLLGAISVSSKE